MKRKGSIRWLAFAGTAFAGLIASAGDLFAQGCALCYTDAAAQGPQARQALNHGIIILLIPPVLIFAGLIAILYRRRHINDAVNSRPAVTETFNLPRPSSHDLRASAHLN